MEDTLLVFLSIAINQSINLLMVENWLSPLNNERQLSAISITYNVSSQMKGISEDREECP